VRAKSNQWLAGSVKRGTSSSATDGSIFAENTGSIRWAWPARFGHKTAQDTPSGIGARTGSSATTSGRSSASQTSGQRSSFAAGGTARRRPCGRTAGTDKVDLRVGERRSQAATFRWRLAHRGRAPRAGVAPPSATAQQLAAIGST
jgi:hypothetical protein